MRGHAPADRKTTMLKIIYLSLVLVVVLPSALSAVSCIHAEAEAKRIQRAEQSRTTGSVYVTVKNFRVGFGPFSLEAYPRLWAAVLFLTGCVLSTVGLVFLFLIRPS